MATEFKSHGITPQTPDNIVLGAGTIHAGLQYTPATYKATSDTTAVEGKTYYTKSGDKYVRATVTAGETSVTGGEYYEVETPGSWNAAESIIGATSGGNKLAITPEITDLEIDGAIVKVAGLAVKTNETATLETNLVEMTPEVFQLATNGEFGAGMDNYEEVKSKARIGKGDYIENFGFVGKRMDGTPIIILFDQALCTSGVEWDAQAKEAGVLAATFECYAPLDGDLETLPWHIYTPVVEQ